MILAYTYKVLLFEFHKIINYEENVVIKVRKTEENISKRRHWKAGTFYFHFPGHLKERFLVDSKGFISNVINSIGIERGSLARDNIRSFYKDSLMPALGTGLKEEGVAYLFI